ncbi:MAG: hypothetical protein ACOC22_03050 [bacterium]
MAIRITKVENELNIKFRYSPELVNKIRSVSGRWWHVDKKYWSVPINNDTI